MLYTFKNTLGMMIIIIIVMTKMKMLIEMMMMVMVMLIIMIDDIDDDGDDDVDRDDDVIISIGEDRIPRELLDIAKGVVFFTIIKVGFMFTGYFLFFRASSILSPSSL